MSNSFSIAEARNRLPRLIHDLNIFSDPMRPQSNRKVMAWFRKHEQEPVVTCVMWCEPLYGDYRLPASHKREDLERYLSDVVLESVSILPHDESVAAWHARERARLDDLGLMAPFVDGQIAAIAGIAATRDLVLATQNVDDFAYFSDVFLDIWHA
jgi:tRNA(fMet)-specific endonuclease VapC